MPNEGIFKRILKKRTLKKTNMFKYLHNKKSLSLIFLNIIVKKYFFLFQIWRNDLLEPEGVTRDGHKMGAPSVPHPPHFNTKGPLLFSPQNPSVQHTPQFNTKNPSVSNTSQFHTTCWSEGVCVKLRGTRKGYIKNWKYYPKKFP